MTTLQIVLLAALAAALLALGAATYLAQQCTAGVWPWVYLQIVRIYMRIMSSWRSNRPCNWPSEGPGIVIANHTSPVDPILIWYRHNADWPKHHSRVAGFMVAKEYVTPRNIVGWICRVMQSIPVNRSGQDTEAVRTALRRLKSGGLLGIFPEGYINVKPEEGLMPFNTGIAYLALKSGVRIYPAFIHGAPRSTGMVACFFKRSKVRITFGEPIDLREHFGDEKKPSMETLQQATDYVRNELTRLGEERWFESR